MKTKGRKPLSVLQDLPSPPTSSLYAEYLPGVTTPLCSESLTLPNALTLKAKMKAYLLEAGVLDITEEAVATTLSALEVYLKNWLDDLSCRAKALCLPSKQRGERSFHSVTLLDFYFELACKKGEYSLNPLTKERAATRLWDHYLCNEESESVEKEAPQSPMQIDPPPTRQLRSRRKSVRK